MAKVYARISMELEMTEDELKELRKQAGVNLSDSTSLEMDISDSLAERFINEGELSHGSYIPAECIPMEMPDVKPGDTVCISLLALFNELNRRYRFDSDTYATTYHSIRKEDDYYDLYKSDTGTGYRLCCDGEQCEILEITSHYVKLIDVENIGNEELEGIDTSFRLTLAEYNIATFTGGKN